MEGKWKSTISDLEGEFMGKEEYEWGGIGRGMQGEMRTFAASREYKKLLNSQKVICCTSHVYDPG